MQKNRVKTTEKAFVIKRKKTRSPKPFSKVKKITKVRPKHPKLSKTQLLRRKFKKMKKSKKKDNLYKPRGARKKTFRVSSMQATELFQLQRDGQELRKNRPEIRSRCWMVTNAKTGAIYWGKNYNIKRQIASLTKVMTCLIACELIDILGIDPKTFECTVSENASQVIGTTANLMCGDKVMLYDLLFCLMLPSGNDAAQTLAENLGCLLPKFKGSKNNRKYAAKAFIQYMNSKCRDFHLLNTQFMNPHGLSNDKSFSTTSDISKIYFQALKYKLFKQVISTQKYVSEI